MNKNSIKIIRKFIDWIKRQPDQYAIWQRLSRFLYLSIFNRRPLLIPNDAIKSEIRSQINIIENKFSNSTAESKWIMFKNNIKKHLVEDNISGFLFWPEILHNMHYVPSIKELNYLKKGTNWTKYKTAIEIKGNNIKQLPFFAFPHANENSIRQAFSLENFFHNTGIGLDKIDQIFEFGGGYGSMCTIIKRLGFNGNYTIFDWPELSILQKYYLKSENVFDDNIFFINDLDNIKLDQSRKTLLIATWSLSECSFDLRDKIISSVNPDFILIAYQKDFGGLENEDYFRNLKNHLRNFSWVTVPFDYIPSQKNKYLFGQRT